MTCKGDFKIVTGPDDGEELGVGDGLDRGVTLGDGLTEDDGVGEPDGLDEGDGLTDGDPLGDGNTEGLGDSMGYWLGLGLGLPPVNPVFSPVGESLQAEIKKPNVATTTNAKQLILLLTLTPLIWRIKYPPHIHRPTRSRLRPGGNLFISLQNTDLPPKRLSALIV